MAENEQKQVSTDAKPVKKRRFYRPRPKVNKDEASAQVNAPVKAVQNQQAPKAAKKPQMLKEQPKVERKPKQAKQQQTAKPMEQAKPKTSEQTKPQAKAKPAEAKKHPLKQMKPMAQIAHKSTKTNGNFKPRRQGTPKLRLSDIDFKYLNTPDFKDIYELVAKAQKYYDKDKETCCAKFRIANEAIIERLVKDLQLTAAVVKKGIATNYFEQINLLAKEIPADRVDSNIFAEMHNIRMIGNSFAHGDDKYNAAGGSKTCLIAMEKICRWLVEFEPQYLSYRRAKDMTKGNFFTDIWNGFLSLFKSK